MRKLWLLFMFAIIVVNLLQAQEKFEFGVSFHPGLYFPEKSEMGFHIDRGIQTGIGLFASYFVAEKTKIGSGVVFNYVKTFVPSFYSSEPIIPILHTIEIPLYVHQQILKTWFIEVVGSASLHTNTTNGKDGVLGRWQIGVGKRIKKLAISINYAQNFKNRIIIVESVQSPSVSFSNYKRKILSVKFEYSLWNF